MGWRGRGIRRGTAQRFCEALQVSIVRTQAINTSSLLLVEMINFIGQSPITWILDFDVSSHICVFMQDLQTSKSS